MTAKKKATKAKSTRCRFCRGEKYTLKAVGVFGGTALMPCPKCNPDTNVDGLPNVQKKDVWVMLIATVRYSMGRTTYMSNLAPELVLRYAQYITKNNLEQIAREIEHELLRCEENGGFLGMECDHKNWRQAAIDIRAAAATKIQ